MKAKLLLLVMTLSFAASAQYGKVDHWEALVMSHEVFKYHEGSSAPGSGWNNTGFNDASWASGRGGWGYGDGDDSTVISNSVNSYFLRKEFVVSDTSGFVAAMLSADYDDGFVAYINGVEIAKANMSVPGVPPHTAFADFEREANLYRFLPYDDFFIRKRELHLALKPGVNVLAIQVHNSSPVSDDMTGWFNLYFASDQSNVRFTPAPSWMNRPPLFAEETNLPIVRVYSSALNDSDLVDGTMEIVYHRNDSMHRFDEAPNHYNGKVGVRWRGNSSLSFPKKSYRIETRTAQNTTNNVSLFDMPVDNDWVLYGPYSDKSLIRNYLAYKMGATMEQYAPRVRLVELMYNDFYRGVYVFLEDIRRGEYRVDIDKLNPWDTTGAELTGGYIMKMDWGSDTSNSFYSGHSNSFPGYDFARFQHEYPRIDSLHTKQRDYIENAVFEFEEALLSDSFRHDTFGYKPLINSKGYADYLLARELGKEIDSYRYSTYFYKDNESDGGRFNMGPIWDFNLGYGNVNFGSDGAEYPRNWMYNRLGSRLWWFARLMEDPEFAALLNCRWKYYRESSFADEIVNELIDETVAEIGAAQERNHYVWKTIGRYVWPNNFVGETYEEEIDYLRDWIIQRLHWMDINLPGDCSQLLNAGFENARMEASSGVVDLYPNPTSGKVTVLSHEHAIEKIIVRTMDGRDLLHKSAEKGQLLDLNLDGVTPGVYLVIAQLENGAYDVQRLVVH